MGQSAEKTRAEAPKGNPAGIHWRDVTVVVPLSAFCVVMTAPATSTDGTQPADGFAFTCVAVAALSLIFWRRFAPLVVLVVAAAIAVYTAHGFAEGPIFLPAVLSLCALAMTASRTMAWAGAGVLVLVTIAGNLIGEGFGIVDFLTLVWLVTAVLVGQAVVAHRERAAAARERQAHREQQALTAERLRIARDLHDSVAHAMTTINVQAGVAARLSKKDPDRVGDTLETIRRASAEALDDLGTILRHLRDDAPREPLPTLAGASALADQARNEGLEVSTDVSGDLDSLSPTVAAAGHRVVQEALTNARKHAGPGTSVEVRIQAQSGGLEIVVEDDGRGRPQGGERSPGLGLIGMRERVESTDGHLTIHERERGGFVVRAAWKGRP